MKKMSSLIFTILFLVLSFEKSLQSVQTGSNNDLDTNNLPNSVRKSRDTHDHLDSVHHQSDGIKQFLNYQLRHKRSFGNEIFDSVDDFEEPQFAPSVVQNVDSEAIPPWIMVLLAQKIKQQREREERTRVKTPRLGRDIEDEIDCQRSRPPFSPRLGKKSVPFKPRLGRSYNDEIRC